MEPNPLGEIFQEFFILVPIAASQSAAYPVRKSDRLQVRQFRDLLELFAEGLKSRSGRYAPLNNFRLFVQNLAESAVRTQFVANNSQAACC